MEALTRIDYQDVFSVKCPARMSTTDALLEFFNAVPSAVKILMGIRNAVVSTLGLKTARHGRQLDTSELRTGNRVGLFEIGSITPKSAMVGADDADLDFRVLLDIQDEILNCTTEVKFNNTLGRVYFFLVKPFHRLVVPAMLKSAVRSFEDR